MEKTSDPFYEKTENPEISIIIATFHSPLTLKCAIKSVLNQDFQDFEILVIGDHCTDHSEDVAKSFGDPRIRWFNLPENIGSQSGPNNEGLKQAKGKFIAYHGHDDLWMPQHLSILRKALVSQNADLVYCLSVMVIQKGAMSVLGGPLVKGRTFENNYHIPPSSWLHRKEMIEIVGLWPDPDRIDAGVDEYYLRLIARAKQKIQYVPSLLIIKFPSVEWSLYSKKGNFPQPVYLDRILKNPLELEREILFDVAVLESKHYYPVPIAWKSFKEFYRAIGYAFFDFYSRDRWPLKEYRIYKFQRFRQRMKKRRGLTKE